MAEPLPKPVQDFFDTIDKRVPKMILAMQAVEGEAHERLSTAIQMGLAMRLVTFALGPAARDQRRVQETALDILAVLQELAQDLNHAPKS